MKVERVEAPYTLGREREMLAAFGRQVFDMLHRRAADVRAQRLLLFADGATDPVGEAIEADRVQGQACRLLGLMGASAHVDTRERASLRDKGLSEREVDQVDAVARRHARAEDARDWLIGPERAVLIFHLDASGIAPTDTNIRRLRAGALCLMAELLERTADRYAVVASHVGDIAAEIMREPDPIPRLAEAPILSRAPESIRPERATEVGVQPSVTEGQNTPKPAEDMRPPASFIGLVEALARSKTNLKARHGM